MVNKMEKVGKMKAVICTKYGAPEVLELKEIEKPQPEDDEVLIRNYGSSINTVDIIARSEKAPKVIFWGARQLIGPFLRLSFGELRKPKQKIPGFGFAGEIEFAGKEVTDWKVGDHVYGYTPGACAEYMTVPAHRLAKKLQM
jgi:NADPH:quinone reductase-like Zn-dependent oxidoreductase